MSLEHTTVVSGVLSRVLIPQKGNSGSRRPRGNPWWLDPCPSGSSRFGIWWQVSLPARDSRVVPGDRSPLACCTARGAEGDRHLSPHHLGSLSEVSSRKVSRSKVNGWYPRFRRYKSFIMAPEKLVSILTRPSSIIQHLLGSGA